MRKVFLLYNPQSGRRRGRRLADVEAALSVLRGAGIEAAAAPTRAAATADQARQAIQQGCDTIFACGGDGTIHDVLQALVGSNVALGIIPMGTANSLAHDLGLPFSPAEAAQAALTATPRRFAVGRVEYGDLTGKPASRYFTVTVGIGVDAHLFYELNATAKHRFGMAAYCLKATHLWLTHKMENFAAEITDGGPGHPVQVSQLLAVRLRDFGGVLRGLAPGAALERDDLRMVLFRTGSRLAYLRYVMRGLLGAQWDVPGIELVHSSGVTCHTLDLPASPATKSRIFVEADGELLGTLPATITMHRDAFSLLTPG